MRAVESSRMPSARVKLSNAPSPAGIVVPADLETALAANVKAKARFETLPPSHRKEFVRAIEDAKKPETRARRIVWTIDKLTLEG